MPTYYRRVVCEDPDISPGWRAWLVFFIMIFFIAIGLVATVYDYFWLQHNKEHPLGKCKFIVLVLRPSVFPLRILHAFSFYTNISEIMTTKTNVPGQIHCVHSIRFFSMVWIISGHCLSFALAISGFLFRQRTCRQSTRGCEHAGGALVSDLQQRLLRCGHLLLPRRSHARLLLVQGVHPSAEPRHGSPIMGALLCASGHSVNSSKRPVQTLTSVLHRNCFLRLLSRDLPAEMAAALYAHRRCDL